MLGNVKASQKEENECKLIMDILSANEDYKDFVLRQDTLYKFNDGN